MIKFNGIVQIAAESALFTKVKESVENAIDNGFNPLAMKARDLAADLVEKANDFAEDQMEELVDAVKQVKEYFGETDEDEK